MEVLFIVYIAKTRKTAETEGLEGDGVGASGWNHMVGDRQGRIMGRIEGNLDPHQEHAGGFRWEKVFGWVFFSKLLLFCDKS